MSKISSKLIVSLIVFPLFAIIFGCTRVKEPHTDKYRETRMMMGTIIHLDVCRSNQNINKIDLAYKQAWERLEALAWRMNVLDERSDVAKINNAYPGHATVKEDTYHVLEHSIHFSQITKGAFDITVWPLIKLWQESEKRNVEPGVDQIKMARAAVGSENIQLFDKNQVELMNRNTKIDLGGIAKGYAIDEAARIFRKHGLMNFFMDAGGDVYVGGHNCSGAPWRIGIKDPRDQSKLIDVVELTNGAVTTSGNYEQYYTIGNEQWSHIMNPTTGEPQKDVVSATVIAPSAMEADALATALCVLGSGAGIEFINSLNDQRACLIIVRRGSAQIQKFSSREYGKYQAQP